MERETDSKRKAKRRAPEPVEPISYQGIIYSLPQLSMGVMGVVEARDEKTDQILWKRAIYTVSYKPNLEKDVQDIFIKKLEIENEMLIVTNEHDQKYEVDLKTGEAKNHGSKVCVPYIDSNTLEIPKDHCCAQMTDTINRTSKPLGEQEGWVCPLVCLPYPVRYMIQDRDGDSFTGIDYCPWCGLGLPGCDDPFKQQFQ